MFKREGSLGKFVKQHESEVNIFLDKLKKPLVWCRLSIGVRIEDLQSPFHEEVIDLIRRHYVPDEPMTMSVKLAEDEDGLEEFLSLCKYWIDDTCSMVAVEEGDKKAIGVLVGRVVVKADLDRELSRMLVSDSGSSQSDTSRRKSLKTKPTMKKSLRRGSKKSGGRKSVARKSVSRKSVSRKSVSRKSVSRKSVSRKSMSRKSMSRKSKLSGGSQGKRKSLTRKSKSEESQKQLKSIQKINTTERISKLRRPVDRMPVAEKIRRVTKVFDDEDVIYQNETLNKIQDLRHHLGKRFDLFKILPHKNKYYRIYLIVVHRDYRMKGIGKAMMKCAHSLCRGFRIDVIAGIFTSFISQNMFFQMGGRNGYEVAYKDWTVEDKVVFADTGNMNFSATFMYKVIQAVETHKPIHPPEEKHKQTVPRRSKAKEKNH